MFIRKRDLFVFCLITSFIPRRHLQLCTLIRSDRSFGAKRGGVAGGQPLSVEGRTHVLQRGGNAVDAGVATILAAR